MSDTDLKLVAKYVRQGAEDAFAQLVARHLALVYSAALRQVRSAQLAEEVAQSTFLKLARQAGRLSPDTMLTAWLYQVTRREAIDVVRREARRQAREQIATEMNAINSAEADWTHLEPLLDQAMDELDHADRAAVLLRYFEKRSLRDVGQALGTSEDAAQKRVARAVEHLRDFFARQGVTVGAGGLGVLLSANAVQAAPTGLAAAVSSVALAEAALPTSTALVATKILLMTTLQKLILTATLVTAVGTGIYQARQATRLRAQVSLLEQQQAPLLGQIAQLQRELASANGRIAGLPRLGGASLAQASPAPLVVGAPDATEAAQRLRQIVNATNWPALTAQQAESYLTSNQRNAASLLAVFRANGDPALLDEALKKYPNDPQVNFAAIFKTDSTPEERRQRLEAFKQTAPDNALGNYLSAANYLKTGQSALAAEELTAASGKSGFQDYSMSFLQNAEEAYRASGYSEAEAKVIAAHSLLQPQLVELNGFGGSMVTLADGYRQAGDEAAAQAALSMGVRLGQSMEQTADNPTLLAQFIGLAIERTSLGAMDPAKPLGAGGQAVGDRLAELAQQRSAVQDLARRFDSQPMSPDDWIAYTDRVKTFGEAAAMQWVVAKHGP